MPSLAQIVHAIPKPARHACQHGVEARANIKNNNVKNFSGNSFKSTHSCGLALHRSRSKCVLTTTVSIITVRQNCYYWIHNIRHPLSHIYNQQQNMEPSFLYCIWALLFMILCQSVVIILTLWTTTDFNSSAIKNMTYIYTIAYIAAVLCFILWPWVFNTIENRYVLILLTASHALLFATTLPDTGVSVNELAYGVFSYAHVVAHRALSKVKTQ